MYQNCLFVIAWAEILAGLVKGNSEFLKHQQHPDILPYNSFLLSFSSYSYGWLDKQLRSYILFTPGYYFASVCYYHCSYSYVYTFHTVYIHNCQKRRIGRKEVKEGRKTIVTLSLILMIRSQPTYPVKPLGQTKSELLKNASQVSIITSGKYFNI